MVELTERRLGYSFGLVGGALVIVSALAALIVGLADAAMSRWDAAAGAGSEMILLGVLGALIVGFAYLAGHRWSDRAHVSGVMLVVLSVVTWAVGGIGSDLIALVGAVLALLAGVLLLIEPASRAARAVVTPA